jgi:hypothetical protein
MQNNIIDITPEKKECKRCNSQKPLSALPTPLLIFTIYFLISAVYGTVKIIENIINLF